MTSSKQNTSRRQNVTLKQIADGVGVSVATVSRVLNFDLSLSVGEQTRQAIIETAEALRYQPPRQRKRKSRDGYLGQIALLHFLRPEEELIDPYYVALRLGIESRCAALKLEPTKLYVTDKFPEASILRGASGLIVIGWHSEEEIEWITSHNQNTVLADYKPLNDSISSVASDLVAATRKLLTALDGLGYERIGFVGWIDRLARRTAPGPEIRCLTYEQWMNERGRFEPNLYATGYNTEESGYELTLKILDQAKRPEVIVTANDNMAVGAYRAINERNLHIPNDIAVASFNDISAARFLNPPLTTVRLPAEKIGENAVDLLVERMSKRDVAKQVNLESKIIWRNSTRTPTKDNNSNN